MSGEFKGGIRIRRGVGKICCWEFMEMNIGFGKRIPAMDTKLGLAVMGGGADVVDGDVVGGDEAGEV